MSYMMMPRNWECDDISTTDNHIKLFHCCSCTKMHRVDMYVAGGIGVIMFLLVLVVFKLKK